MYRFSMDEEEKKDFQAMRVSTNWLRVRMRLQLHVLWHDRGADQAQEEVLPLQHLWDQPWVHP